MRLSRYFNGPLLTAAFATLVFATGAVVPVQAQQDGRATISEVQASEPEAPGKFESPAYIIEEAGTPDFGREVPDGSLRIEVEPNNSAAQAESIDPVAGAIKVRGEIQPLLDTDWFAFNALAGDRVYAGTVTHNSGGSTDTFLAVIASDGTTILEEDDNDGGFSTSASTVANVNIPTDGVYYLRVRSSATGRVAPCALYAHVRRGTPTPETEPNENGIGGQPIPPSLWVSGYLSAISPTESDLFTNVTAQAGDTIVAFLDMDPDRAGGVRADGRLGIATFGSPGLILVVNRVTTAGFPAPPAEAMYMTVKDAGTYSVYVDTPTATGTGTTGSVGNYTLSVAVIPAQAPSGQCATFSSGVIDAPLNDSTVNGGLTEFTLAVPDSFRIGDADLRLRLNHTFMPDLDAVLISPQGTPLPVFTDVGASSQVGMDAVFDDEGALSLTANFAAIANQHRNPEAGRRMAVFDGQDSQGTWTLRLYDDAGGDVGTLNEWSLRLCAAPPPPVCPVGSAEVEVYATDFETDAGGFTTDANAPFVPDWARGLPTTPALNRCNGGSANCFVTNLTGTYANGAVGNPLSENLRSPAIDLTGLSPPVTLYWAHAHQIESVTFDRITATAQEPGGLNPMVFYRSNNPTLGGTTSVGPAPVVPIQEHYGWGEFQEDLSAFAGGPVELEFNLLSDDSVPREGWGIDDIRVTACEEITETDLSITKTDGVTTVTPGQTTTYTIVASNGGLGLATGATVVDTFPAALTGCTWTCTGAGGGTCSAGGSGNINDTVNLPPGASVTYIAQCTVSPSASGSIVNTATVNVPSGITDPNTANNSATDTNTVDTGPGGADVSLVIVNDRNFVQLGENVSLTVAVQNSGPDAAPAVTIAGAVPAELTSFSWSCTAIGGATCGAPSGIGSFSTSASLPGGSTVLYAVQGSVTGEDANGSVAFSASATVEAPVVDPDTSNNTDTWDAEVVIFRNGFECTLAGVEGNGGGCAPPPPVTTVLVDEFTGRYQTAATGGPGGAPISALQTALTLSTFGAGAQIVNNNSVADDFTVPAGGWTVERMRFFTYQTGSTTTSTINDLRLRIFAGTPGGTLVFGDTTTNRLTSTSFNGIYRVQDTTPTNNQRPTMEMVVEFNPPLALAAGTYWFAWQAGGTLASGPWAPPQTVVGQTNTGNAQQSLAGAAFAPLIDTGASAPQGIPFIIEGLE